MVGPLRAAGPPAHGRLARHRQLVRGPLRCRIPPGPGRRHPVPQRPVRHHRHAPRGRLADRDALAAGARRHRPSPGVRPAAARLRDGAGQAGRWPRPLRRPPAGNARAGRSAVLRDSRGAAPGRARPLPAPRPDLGPPGGAGRARARGVRPPRPAHHGRRRPAVRRHAVLQGLPGPHPPDRVHRTALGPLRRHDHQLLPLQAEGRRAGHDQLAGQADAVRQRRRPVAGAGVGPGRGRRAERAQRLCHPPLRGRRPRAVPGRAGPPGGPHAERAV